MEDLQYETRLKGVWCISARVSPKPAMDGERRLGIDAYEPGAKVFCFPPARPDPETEVKIIGPRKRTGKYAIATVLAKHLFDWRADYLLDRNLIPELSPPWDEDAESHDVADKLCQWREGIGEWPTQLLREWNRTRVQRTIGAGPWYKRAAAALKAYVTPADVPVKPKSKSSSRKMQD
ncbi:MAG TPA: hypothetical protein VFC78_02505 [Tepidisphaeraceae bacterium]|nr:hypothetical protein [Tepidisphaeraceae bacterium]